MYTFRAGSLLTASNCDLDSVIQSSLPALRLASCTDGSGMTVVSMPSKYGMSGRPTDLPNHQLGLRFTLIQLPVLRSSRTYGPVPTGWASAFFGSSWSSLGEIM